MRVSFGTAVIVLLATLGFVANGTACRSTRPIKPPEQPAFGPGGASYAHEAFRTERIGVGGGECWIFTPDEPRPTHAPVVVFMHGWGALDPYVYGAWIRHLVQRGNIVIYPRYQATLRTRFDDMTPNAMNAVAAAFRNLEQNGPVRPTTGQSVVVGHSMGGFVAANYAALAKERGPSPPKALMVVEPGDGDGRMPRLGKRLELAEMSGMPDGMLFLMVTGIADSVVGDRGAAKIWAALEHLPTDNKNFLTVPSDDRPRPRLVADHFSPLAIDRKFPEWSAAGEEGSSAQREEERSARIRRRFLQQWARRFEPDALDYYGYWRLLDGLIDASIHGADKTGALAASESARWMGICSDGTPVRPLILKRVR